MNNIMRLALFLAALALTPLGPLVLYAKGFQVQQYRIGQPKLAPPVVPNKHYGKYLFKELHDEVSKDGTFEPLPYDQARFYLYSQVDQMEIEGRQGLKDLYSGLFIEGVSGLDGCYKECADANGDGRINIDDLIDADREYCRKNERVPGRSNVMQCKAGDSDVNGDKKTGDFLNAEHLWPQSSFKEHPELVGDLHNLRPSFAYRNTSRASRHYAPYGPPIDHKMHGDVARAIFYFALTYYDRMDKTASGIYFADSVPVLMEWNRLDPPDAHEKARTARAAAIQGNTNPFVEHPEYVDKIGRPVWQSLFPQSSPKHGH